MFIVAVAKKGWHTGATKWGKWCKVMAVADRTCIPVAVYLSSATPHEATLVESVLREHFTVVQSERLVRDRAHEAAQLDEQWGQRGIELIAPHRRNRGWAAMQDGRSLRRYKRRCIERMFAWLQNDRKMIISHERYRGSLRGLLHLACIKIYLKRF